MLAAAATTAPTAAEVAPGAKPVVAIVEVATPWYAPAFLDHGDDPRQNLTQRSAILNG